MEEKSDGSIRFKSVLVDSSIQLSLTKAEYNLLTLRHFNCAYEAKSKSFRF